MRYIQYEMNLDKLRTGAVSAGAPTLVCAQARKALCGVAVRRRRLGIKKLTKHDAACRQHVFFIYERMLRKFKGRVDLWLQVAAA
jgi:hypothetical protein